MVSSLQTPPSVAGIALVIRRKFTQPSRQRQLAADALFEKQDGLAQCALQGSVTNIASSPISSAASPAPEAAPATEAGSAQEALQTDIGDEAAVSPSDTEEVREGSSGLETLSSPPLANSEPEVVTAREVVVTSTPAADAELEPTPAADVSVTPIEEPSAASSAELSVAEEAHVAEPLAGSQPAAAEAPPQPDMALWNALREEFDTQLRIWESLALVTVASSPSSRGQQQRSRPPEQPPQALLSAMIEAALQAVETDPEGAAKVLEAALRRDAEEEALLNRATRAAAVAVVQAAPGVARRRHALVEELEQIRLDRALSEALPSSTSSQAAPVSLARTESSPAPAAKASSGSKPKTCDKCDGKHPTEECPHFQKPRERHKDAWVNYGVAGKGPRQMGAGGGNFVLHNGRCVPQPGDGSCLFHSLCFGLNRNGTCEGLSAERLRGELAGFIERNPKLEIAGDTLEEWVRWDTNSSVSSYARRMSISGWGGGLEMAACSILKRVNVHVYERRWLGGYKRISCFDAPGAADRTIHVLYQGGVHYDALVVN